MLKYAEIGKSKRLTFCVPVPNVAEGYTIILIICSCYV